MAVRTISTSIKLDGEQEFKKQMASVNSELKNLKSEMALATAEFKGNANSMEALTAKGQLLRREYDQQAEKVRALERAVEDASEAYGEADSRTDAYKRQLNYAKTALANLNSEIQDNERYLDEAKRSADRCADSIDEYGREVRDAADTDIGSPFSSIDDVVGKLGSIKGALLGGAAVAGVQAVTGAVTQVVDASAEYRKIMGTLEVSSQAAGYSAEETAQTYERLYSVLGDNQTAATTVANLQAIGLSQEDLMAITDSVIGAWAKYGDSIPIDGLGEAINESIRCGEVTGVLADVLNWGSQEGETFGVKMRESTEANKEWNESVENAKTAEDYFNLALSQCSTDAERADLVLQTLAKQGLADAGQAWIDTNDDIIAANESQAAFEEAQANLGEKLSPFKDALTDLGTAGFNFLADCIDGVSGAFQDLGTWWENTQPKLEKGWDNFWDSVDAFFGVESSEIGENAGENIVRGVQTGMKNREDALMDDVEQVTSDIEATAKKNLKIASPSKVFQSIGEYMMEGLALGMENGKGEVMETVEDLVKEVEDRFDAFAGALSVRQDVSDLQYQLWEMTDGKAATEEEKYAKQLEFLNQQQVDQAGIVEAAKEAYQAVAEQYGENNAESLEYQKTLLQEQLAYEKLLEKIQEVIDAKQELASYDGTGIGGSRTSVDGSHAGGLWRVPYDGYVAELHRNETVLNAQEADVWRSMQGAAQPVAAVTAADLRTVTASAVNALGTMNSGGGGRYVCELHVHLGEKEFYRQTIDAFRAVNRENPEVMDDR